GMAWPPCFSIDLTRGSIPSVPIAARIILAPSRARAKAAAAPIPVAAPVMIPAGLEEEDLTEREPLPGIAMAPEGGLMVVCVALQFLARATRSWARSYSRMIACQGSLIAFESDA